MDTDTLRLVKGKSNPLGSRSDGDGVNFALYSKHASHVRIALFDAPESNEPVTEFLLEPKTHRSGDVWCARIEGLDSGALYCYRVEGPRKPRSGFYFEPERYLLDPYARVLAGNRPDSFPKCVAGCVSAEGSGPARPRTPMNDTIIYEMHVKGFTAHGSSGVEHPGTYRGLIERIPYLRELGITAVELLPVPECGEGHIGRENPETGEPLVNYWGYSPVNFFAPAGRYAADGDQGKQLAEFREMVDALHEAGIEVILDVVYNHTSEGGKGGRAQSFRGIDCSVYYLLGDSGNFLDFTGCGNTVNCNYPAVSDLIVESLRSWVSELHVDGFRFDLATVLNRDRKGELHQNAPVVDRVSKDAVLHGCKLIAEAWDLGGGYQVGHFGNTAWSDWNGQFRDDVRQYWHGAPHTRARFALRVTGSPDIYQANGRGPHHSINFITAHDGFTLRDLVSYKQKHNKANGEDNRDGADNNFSSNQGVEGETDNPEVNEVRLRLQKSFLTTLFVSLGTPMLLGGDEFGRTQRGNNNAYCQDNEISWFNWDFLETNAELFAFCKGIIQFRKENPVFRRKEYFTGQPCDDEGNLDIAWYGPQREELDWEDGGVELMYAIHPSQNEERGLCLLYNPSPEAMEFLLPEGEWCMRINTANQGGEDIRSQEDAPLVEGESLVVGRKSVIILASA